MKQPILFLASVLVYISTVGPWLISAPNTIAVLAGLALAVGLGYWAIRIINRTIPSNNKE